MLSGTSAVSPPYIYGAPYYGYGYGGYGYPGYYFYPAYLVPRRAPGETYALVVSWIVTVAGGLAVVGGLLLSLLFLAASASGQGNSLSFLGGAAGFTLAPTIGGAFALYFGIRGIMRRPSPRFSIPNPWIFIALAVVAFVAGIVIWNTSPAPGPAIIVMPLAILTGVLPALAIFSFAAWRLHFPSTRRHVWMSLIYGAAGATTLAIIFEALATIIILLILVALGNNITSAITNPTGTNPQSPLDVLVLLLTVSVVAPIIEEGVKPLGAVFIMRRLKTPASAFLMGLAAGVGFDMFETIGYIGMGQADWINVAIDRLGAGLLHGVGAGMGALGWYYFINGKGVPQRWLRGIGCLLYAVLQHAIFNGSNVIPLISPPFAHWSQQIIFIGKLPVQYGDVLYFAFYAIMLGVLVYITGRLARSRQGQPPIASAPVQPADSTAGNINASGVTPVGSSAR